MATHLDVSQQWVLVTGASSGLGHEIAWQLASVHKARLILAARSVDKLNALRDKVEAIGGECQVLQTDLSKPENYGAIFQQLEAYSIKAAVLNAGVTYFGEDRQLDWHSFETMLHTNVSSVVFGVRWFNEYFESHNIDGATLVVGSMAGLTPVPYQSAYSGSKAFLSHYCQSLQQEISNKPYSLGFFAPGGIDTEMNSGSGLDQYFKDSFFIQSVESCASDAITTLLKRKPLYVPRLSNRLQVLMVKLLPRILVNRFTAVTYRKALKAKR